MKERYRITGMSCAACSARVQRVTEKLEGMRGANVNLLAGMMEVDYDETRLTPEAIIAAVTEAGYGAEKLTENAPRKNTAQEEALKPVDEPTQADRIEAQVMYTALMTDTLLDMEV